MPDAVFPSPGVCQEGSSKWKKNNGEGEERKRGRGGKIYVKQAVIKVKTIRLQKRPGQKQKSPYKRRENIPEERARQPRESPHTKQ